MELYQKEKGYRYNSDTLFLYDFIASFSPKKGSLLDVGCGCGILGLLLKRDFECLEVSLLDIQEDNCSISCKNALHNHLNIHEVIHDDFLTYSFAKKYDYIVSNPPFYHQNTLKSTDEHLCTSRHSSYLPLEALIKKTSQILSNRGYVLLCYDAKQSDTLIHLLHQEKLKVENIRFVYTKLGAEASLILVCARKNSKTACKIEPPLVVMKENTFTQEAQAIFTKSQTKSVSWQG